MCEVIIDNGFIEKIMSKKLVTTLDLSTNKHPHLYKIGWISERTVIQLIELCRIPFSIGSHYQDEVTCDMVEMDACHILLGSMAV